MSLADTGVEVQFNIDETKITVVTRAERLQGLAIGYLTSLQDTAVATLAQHDLDEGQRLILLGDTANLSEIISWLSEKEI